MIGARQAPTTLDLRNRDGAGPFVVVCEHASNHIPSEFASLGVDAGVLAGHIAWDPGALGVAVRLSELLDAPLVAQGVSRLLYDCNRPPSAPSSIPETSEVHPVPGNRGLSTGQRRERAERFYHPFRDALAALLAERGASGPAPVLVTVHTFTPIYFGARREVEIGILHDADSRLADAMLAAAGDGSGFVVRRNEPYGPADGVTHTLREHALPARLLNVMIEIRNDLVAAADAQARMAETLAGWLRAALAAASPATEGAQT